MLGIDKLYNLRTELEAKYEELRRQNWRQAIAEKVDERVRVITAGANLEEIRAMLRGDPPTERPNPRYRIHTTSFWAHIRPRFYQKAATKFTHTFHLGYFTAFFFIIEVLTGIFLMIFYAPAPARAYGDMLDILSNVPYGKFMRDLHRFGAEGMVIFVFLHMHRVFLTGAYKRERSFTWMTGVVLLVVTLILSFSGYLLPWDQLAYWAVTIGTSMAEAAPVGGERANLILRGAPDIGAGGLLRFYLLHIFLLPLLAIVFISVHYYKVAREHSISLPADVEEGQVPEEEERAGKERIDLIPELVTDELFLAAVGVFICVASVATWFEAPLESHADPTKTPLHTTAPWYFLWVQGLLKLGDKTFMGVILPTLLVGLLFAIPYIDEFIDWLRDKRGSRLARNRPIHISLWLGGIVVFLVLSWMGTPSFGVVAPPAVEIAQEFVPEEGLGTYLKSPGPVRLTPYEELEPGVYSTQEFSLSESPSRLEQIFAEFKAEVEERDEGDDEFNQAIGAWVIEQWQEDLKKVTIRIEWQNPEEGPQTFEDTTYVHRESNYE